VKLNQLLQFSRPAVRSGNTKRAAMRGGGEEVSSVLRHEADRRGVALKAAADGAAIDVATSAESLNDIVSNLWSTLWKRRRAADRCKSQQPRTARSARFWWKTMAGNSGCLARKSAATVFHDQAARHRAGPGDRRAPGAESAGKLHWLAQCAKTGARDLK